MSLQLNNTAFNVPAPPDLKFVDTVVDGITEAAFINEMGGTAVPYHLGVTPSGASDSKFGLNMTRASAVIDVPLELGAVKINISSTWNTLAAGAKGPLCVVKVTKLPSTAATLTGLPEIANLNTSLRDNSRDVAIMKKELNDMKMLFNNFKESKISDSVVENNVDNESLLSEIERLKLQMKAIMDFKRLDDIEDLVTTAGPDLVNSNNINSTNNSIKKYVGVIRSSSTKK
jgi:hypothetical protein